MLTVTPGVSSETSLKLLASELKDQAEVPADVQEAFILDTYVSFYTSHWNTKSVETQTLSQIFDDIHVGKWQDRINGIRESYNTGQPQAGENNKKKLPGFTVSGVFSNRSNAGISFYSQLIILDYDNISETQLAEVRLLIETDPHTFCCFISVRGMGLKVVVRVSSTKDKHGIAYQQVADYYDTLTGLTADKSGKDISRLCYVSDDPDLYCNSDSEIFQIINPVPTMGTNSVTILPQKSFQECVEIVTLQNGEFKTGNRNNFVFNMACLLHKNGHTIEQAQSQLLANYGYNKGEVIKSVNSAYKYPVFEAIPTREGRGVGRQNELETILRKLLKSRFNIVTGRLEVKLSGTSQFETISDMKMHSIVRAIRLEGFTCTVQMLNETLLSDFSSRYNAFEDYFEGLNPWDGETDYIGQLAATVITTQPQLWRKYFEKWLVALVGCALEEHVTNQTVIVFTGPQGVGKTTWIERLVPTCLKAYLYSGTIQTENKDTQLFLSEKILINLDELENLNRSETNSLKQVITQTHVSVRRAYAHFSEQSPRRASFIGSVNNSQFLSDPTGSRRFLCFEVNSITYQHEVDMDNVYSQALSLFRSGFQYWFSGDEIAQINQNNQAYRMQSMEEELLLKMFQPSDPLDAQLFLSSSEVLLQLKEQFGMHVNYGSPTIMGKVLNSCGFHRVKKQQRYVYAMNPFNPGLLESL